MFLLVLFKLISNSNYEYNSDIFFQKNIEINSIIVNKITNNTIKSDITNEKIIWEINIPKIDLIAKIHDGTDSEILNEYVGHFKETPKLYGNIGLAAHNRGYKVNYFENIKNLNIGDKIYYKYKNFIKVYEVEKQIIIEDTNWKILENTKDNYLTLITCLENKPSQRRCIIAKEI